MIGLFAFVNLIQIADCLGAAPASTLVSPSVSQINAPNQPTFKWTNADPSTPDNCTYDFLLLYDTQSKSCDQLGFSIALTPFTGTVFTEMNTNWLFTDSTPIYWCVGTRYTGTAPYTYSSVQSFTTRASSPVSPSFATAPTIPATSSLSPSGTNVIGLNFTNGEENATENVYLQSTTGGSPTLLGSVIENSDPAGAFQFWVDLDQYGALSGVTQFTFYAISVRGGSTSSGAPYHYSTYYYDPGLGLAAPVLSNIGNTLNWTSVSGATTYIVWRRHEQDTCTSNCYLGNRPFEYFDETSALSDDVTSGVTSAAIGDSFFVTANIYDGTGVSSGNHLLEASPRSNSISFNDTTAPDMSQISGTISDYLKYIELTSGRDAVAYLCSTTDLTQLGYYNGDNSADLFATVYATPAPGQNTSNCGAAVFTSSVPQTFRFDTLLPVYTSFGNIACLEMGQFTGLTPSTAYCFKTCFADKAGNPSGSCFFTSDTTNAETVSPDFAGLTTVTVDASGTGATVNWNLPANDGVTRGTYKYDIEWVETDDSNSTGIFSATPSSQTVNNSSATTYDVTGLLTGTRYCFRAYAEDEYNLRGPATSTPICTTTLDNRPEASNISIGVGNPSSPYIIPISFQITDREWSGSGDDQISLGSVSYSLDNGKTWVAIQSKYLSGVDFSHLPAAPSIAQSPVINLNFNTLAYFSGQRDFEIQIVLNKTLNSETYTSAPTNSSSVVLFRGMSLNSGYTASTSTGACSLEPNAKLSPRFLFGFLCIISGFLFFRLRMRRS